MKLDTDAADPVPMHREHTEDTGWKPAPHIGRLLPQTANRQLMESSSDASRAHEDNTPALSIVIPTFNEARRIVRTLEEITSFAALAETPIEILVSDDGSTDTTVQRASAFTTEQACTIRVIPCGEHRGKGYVVRQGVLAARGEIILICDADMSTPLDQIDRLRPWLDRGFDVVVGSRRMEDSVLDPPQPWHRRAMDTVFRVIRRRVLLPEIRDTQCGFKCFTREAAHAVFARAIVDGFAFDCEVLALADRLGHRIKEVGVLWKNDPDSRVRPFRDASAMLVDLWKIRRTMRAKPRRQNGPPRNES